MERKTTNVKKTYFFAIFIAITMLCSTLPFHTPHTAYATDQNFIDKINFGKIQQTRPASLKVTYYDTDKTQPLKNVNVRLYHLAQMQKGLPINPTYKKVLQSVGWERFAKSQSSQPYTISDWDKMGKTIADLIQTQNYTPDIQATSNEQGIATFTNLKIGIYLVITDSFTIEEEKVRYHFQPILLLLPQIVNKNTTSSVITNTNNDETYIYSYDVSVTPKHTKDPIGKKVNYKLIKHWDDVRNTTKRPKTILVDILRDKQLYKTIKLDESNQWSYTWETIENQYDWIVAERVQGKNYTVTNDKRGTTFIVTNSLKPQIPKVFADTGINGYFIVLLPLFLLTGMIILLVAKKRKAKDQK